MCVCVCVYKHFVSMAKITQEFGGLLISMLVLF